jgi:hypothetical protein
VCGLNVWRDKKLLIAEAASTRHPLAIDAALKCAERVLALWSRHLAGAPWVLSETEKARKASKLVQIILGECELPPHNVYEALPVLAQAKNRE